MSTVYINFKDPTFPAESTVGPSSPLPVELRARNDAGAATGLAATAEGHLEVAIHGPRLPFGSVHAESMTPIFQSDAVYGINSGQVQTTASGSGSATAANSLFSASTGTTALSQGVILGRKRLRYRPGQGIIGRFAGKFTSPVTYSYQIMGFGHAEDGVYVGYREATGNGASGIAPAFGVLYVNRAHREVRTLTVTTGSSTAQSLTITLNSIAFSVAVTNSANIQRTVWEIAQGVFAGWDAYPSGATVVFVSKSANAKSGTYSLAGTTAVGTFAQTRAGATGTETFIPQSEWNGDKLDGTGASGFTIDPTKGNVFEIQIQYLGFGAIVFKAEIVPATGQNNADFVTIHTLKLPNTLALTSFGNPSFPFTMAAYSAGSTTNLTVSAGSFAGFIEGPKILHGNRFTYFNSLTTVGATNFQALFTVSNARFYGGQTSQVVINILAISGALKHTSPCVYYLIKNGALVGNPNFVPLAANSATLWDTAATTVTYSTGDQLLWTGHIGDTGEIDHHFGGTSELNMEEVTLQPGEWITLAAKAITGTPAYVTGSMNTREDQ